MPQSDITKVLIVGAGPVGLSLAVELGLRGIECTLIERGDGNLTVPRMSSVSARGMEFCRRWGIADEVRSAVWSNSHPCDFVYVSTMIGEELARLKFGSHNEQRGKLEYSPEGRALCPQIFFDPILARKANSLSQVTVLYNTELKTFEQDNTGVRARIVDKASGSETIVTSDYLVGCDGAGGTVRRQLGIALDGPGQIATSVNVFFRSADFSRIHDKGWAYMYRFLDDAGCWGEVVAIDGKELWRLSVFHDENPDLSGRSYLRKLAGQDFAFEILDVSPWERRDCLAQSYRKGRVLIAGDTAHQMSPTGGAGMHTGLCDAFNLAWKIAAIYQGWAGSNLLDSYELECRPLAMEGIKVTTEYFNSLVSLPGIDKFREMLALDPDIPRRFSPAPQLLAQVIYGESPICISDGTPPLKGSTRLKPSARPGTRAPHCWIANGRSTLDLFGDGFVLMRFAATDNDVAELLRAASERNFPLEIVDIDSQDATSIFERSLVLVRPDGHVAWRGDAVPSEPERLVDRVRGA